MATTELDTLLIRIAADTAGLRGEMAKANQAVAKSLVAMQKEAHKTNEAFGRMSAGIKGLISGLLSGLSVAQLIRMGRATLEWADQIKTLADRLGTSTDSVQELIFAGREVNITTAEMTKGMESFAVKFAEAASGKGRGVTALKALGIDARDAQGNVKNLDQTWAEFAEKIKKFDRTSQIAIAKSFFGDEGALKFLDLLGQGAGAMERLKQKARETGAVVDADLIARGEQLNKSFERLTDRVNSDLRTAFLNLAPLLDNLVTKVTAAVDQMSRLKLGPEALGPLMLRDLMKETPPPLTGEMRSLLPRTRQETPAGTKRADLSAGAGSINEFEKKLIKIRHEAAALNHELKFDKASAAFNKLVLDFAETGSKVQATTAQVKLFSRTLMEIEQTKSALAIKEFADQNARLVEITAAEATGNRELVAVLEARFALEDKLGQKLNERQAAQIEGLARTRFKIEENRQQIQALQSGISGALESGAAQMTDAFSAFFDKSRNGWEEMGNVAINTLKAIAQEMLMVAAIRPLAQAAGEGISSWLGLALNIGGAVAGAGASLGGGMTGGGKAGFASGGSFNVGGSGGTDTTPVRFWATPGERVTVQTPDQISRGGMGGANTTYIDARGADASKIEELKAIVRSQGRTIRNWQAGERDRVGAHMVDVKRRGGAAANVF